MATSSSTPSSFAAFGGLGDGFPEDDFGPELTDLDVALPAVPSAEKSLDSIASTPEEAVPNYEIPEDVEPKDLLNVRGFFVSAGAGIYDGATRDNEEPRDSHYVDVQDYETGEINRVWGVVLGEVMQQATANHDLQPGSRVHLIQQGKREIFIDSVNEKKEMLVRKTHANAWVCMPDRGPLPSQLAHLMAGINVDQILDRIAMRHDMGLDDERLPAWKQEQKRILRAFGDDPQTVKVWLSRQMALSSDDERRLIAAAVELGGYSDAEPVRKQHEIDMRLAAIREMSADARYDFLMESAKPHLIARNREKEEGLRHEVVEAIEQVAVMATSAAHPDAPARKAMRSALAQSLEGLSLTQQIDYLGQRRDQVLRSIAASLTIADAQAGPSRVSRTEAIDATGLTSEEYQLLLEERFALAETQEEKAAMMAQEIEARKQAEEGAQAEFDAIDKLYQRFSRERDVDATAYIAGQAVLALGRLVSNHIMPRVATTFEALGGLGAWRKNGCESSLQDMRDALFSAKKTATYQAFVNDPLVAAACVGSSPAEMVAKHPDFARTEVVMGHLDAQESAQAPSSSRGASEHKGLWKSVLGAAHTLTDRVSHMSPEHLIKRGAIDNDWVKGMQAGLQEFGQELKETLMPEKLRAQIQEMIASILASIRMMMDMAMALLTGKKAEPSLAGMER